MGFLLQYRYQNFDFSGGGGACATQRNPPPLSRRQRGAAALRGGAARRRAAKRGVRRCVGGRDGGIGTDNGQESSDSRRFLAMYGGWRIRQTRAIPASATPANGRLSESHGLHARQPSLTAHLARDTALLSRARDRRNPPSRTRVLRAPRRSGSVRRMSASTSDAGESVSRPAVRHARKHPRTIAPPLLPTRDTLADRAIRWLLPWTMDSYPGRQRGIVEILNGAVGWYAVRGWKTGRRTLPTWAARRVAEAIETRCMHGWALVQELRSYADVADATPRKLHGFCAVDESTGADRRGLRRRIGHD